MRDAIIAAYPLDTYLQSVGKEVVKGMACCPLHHDTSPSMSVNLEKGLWNCFGCHLGGTVIDLHMRLNGMTPKEAMFDLAEKKGLVDDTPRKVETYKYRDPAGRECFRVDRIEKGRKKGFRQYHREGEQIVPNMKGVTRTLYRIEQWHGKEEVSLCEGEKTVHALEKTGRHATTNPGGSNAWLDAYAESLKGKLVEVWPDRDEAGELWLEAVMESLAGKVKALKIMRVPEPYNDFADVWDACGEDRAQNIAADLSLENDWIEKGVRIDLLSAEEAYRLYRKQVHESEKLGIDLGKWLPSFKRLTRPLMPGDLMAIIADTGVGKTGLLVSLAASQAPLPIVFFELELSPEPMTERFVANSLDIDTWAIEGQVKRGTMHPLDGWGHVFICPKSNLTLDQMESLILQSELKIGRKPALVMVDYIQLMTGRGESRYARASDVAEGLKRLARNTGTVVVFTSQVARKADRSEITLHDGKDSGSIESSAQLVLGVWPEDEVTKVRILKQTRKSGNPLLDCRLIGDRQKIVELDTGLTEEEAGV